MTIARYQANIVLNQWFTNSAPSVPSSYYIGLSTTTPVASTGLGFTEPSGNGYARVSVSNSGGWSTSTLNTLNNTSAITFPESTATWGTITYVLVFDSLTSGNLLWFEALSTPRAVAALTTVNFAASTFTVILS